MLCRNIVRGLIPGSTSLTIAVPYLFESWDNVILATGVGASPGLVVPGDGPHQDKDMTFREHQVHGSWLNKRRLTCCIWGFKRCERLLEAGMSWVCHYPGIVWGKKILDLFQSRVDDEGLLLCLKSELQPKISTVQHIVGLNGESQWWMNPKVGTRGVHGHVRCSKAKCLLLSHK